ncbi:ATP-binding cassette domain-containing protein [candidate division KSB1 bacterium]|jgi:ABC-type iron transport system FetAB ATPase subunit|nr:ATP-binding cassette domain-containing protein [candidate division KSB1 bacterium]
MSESEKIVFQAQDVQLYHLGPYNLDIKKGEIAGISGPSGAGKTLFLRACADLEPHEGQLFLENKPASEFNPAEWRKKVTFLSTLSQWWYDKVGDHFSAMNTDWLNQLGFDESVYQWTVSRLSSGERQRLAVLRVLLLKPMVLLLDEPTSNLDGNNVKRVQDLIISYQNDKMASILWVSHSKEQIESLADRHYWLENGTLAEL